MHFWGVLKKKNGKKNVRSGKEKNTFIEVFKGVFGCRFEVSLVKRKRRKQCVGGECLIYRYH